MKKLKLRTGTVLMMGFLLIILLGSVLLYMPFKHNHGVVVSYLDCLFVSVSAVCVTGLTPLDIAATLNVPGRIVLLALIQVGGLGFATFAVFVLRLLGRNVGYSSRTLAKDALNMEGGMKVISLVKIVVKYAFAIEAVGGLLLTVPYLSRTDSFLKALGMGFFHSISAFNNAGFDLNGNFSSLAAFRGDLYTNLVVALLIILGAMGFFVMSDVLHNKVWSRFSFHTKIALSVSGFLVVAGFLLLWLLGM
ncbi:MAG: ATPase, partial [Spirochaetales bacterium]|nr:ATPase [Candidatus Physcosoma equi]